MNPDIQHERISTEHKKVRYPHETSGTVAVIRAQDRPSAMITRSISYMPGPFTYYDSSIIDISSIFGDYPVFVSTAPTRLRIDELAPQDNIFFDRDASTSIEPIPEILERTISEIFASCKNEDFAYGYTSRLAILLEEFIQVYGADAIRAIQQQIPQRHVSVDVVVETLHTLGQLDHEASNQYRLHLLLASLTSPLARLRCAAAFGLAYMDDPRAISSLEKALVEENYNSAKVCFQRVLEQLRATTAKLDD